MKTESILDDVNFLSLLDSNTLDYDLHVSPDDTVSDVIYNYLFERDTSPLAGDGGEIAPHILKYYKDKIDQQVSKGLPVDFFLSVFAPKFNIKGITNGNYLPDIADLTTLIHLHRVANKVREVYDYNFRFFVVYKGRTFRRMGEWNDDDLKVNFGIIKKFNEIASTVTGSKNSVYVREWDEFLGTYSELFRDALKKKTMEYVDLWSKRKEPIYSDLEKWKNGFGIYFSDEYKMHDNKLTFTREACKVRATNSLLFRDGDFLNIVNDINPNLMILHTRDDSKFFSIKQNPYFNDRNYFKLTALDDGVWKSLTWNDMVKKGGFKAICKKEFEHPIYFSNDPDAEGDFIE